MAAGTAQESRLAIVIDTRDSEARIKRLRDALNGLGGTANNAGAGANAAGAGALCFCRQYWRRFECTAGDLVDQPRAADACRSE